MPAENATETASSVGSDLLTTLRWRCIGPFRGGRVVAVAGDPSDQMVFYFGACAGGVWKTYDGGAYWENVSDGFFNTASVGAIAVAESDPNVVYAGGGEACIRGDVSHGDGVYRSTDGGKTWVHLGLEDTRHISRIRVHPRDPDLVYVAALGHAFGPNSQRGIFRSKDGGANWERVLFRGERAGAADLSIDPGNPRIMYAAIWQALREPWNLTSGGPGSGLFKSVDGGDTWTEITGSPGLPEGVKGRMGIAVSPARSDRVWAIVEAEDGGLFRSDNGGAAWERVSDDRNLQQRPWYYSHVFADPQDPDTVYVLNLKAWKSTDGGRTFTQVTTPHGDNHDLWIDPRNPQRMIEGNDGGACVSFNGGASWSDIFNQPTAQFYNLATDSRFPYRVYGTQQDNTAISVPSRSLKGAISWNECYPVGNSECGYIAVRQDDPDIVYSGTPTHGGDYLLRYDHRNGQVRIISPWPENNWGYGVKDHKYRFQWTYPIVLSPHDPNVLYVAANVVLVTEDEGSSWKVISPDLTRNDVTKMGPSGGPITVDTTGPEHYGTIFAFAESPQRRGVFWAGSDDGLVHVSTDGGENWENVTPGDLPEWTRISVIEPSPHDPASAYIAATRYRLDDPRPYLYKTSDYGKTWTRIVEGIPGDDFTRVVREDPHRRGLLYAGSETGVYVSFDDGASWQPLRLNLPAVPVYDLAVKDDELVAATHGRSFWILDGLPLLRQLSVEAEGGPVRLFAPADAYRVAPSKGQRLAAPGKNYGYGAATQATYYARVAAEGDPSPAFLNVGENPPDGVVVEYYLAERAEAASIEFLDSEGRTVRRFSIEPEDVERRPGEPEEPAVPAGKGMNRFVWDMRYADARGVPGAGVGDKGLTGPLALPGAYEVRLTVGERVQSHPFALLADPNAAATDDDLEAQRDLLLGIRDKRSETSGAVHRIDDLRRQVDEWARHAEGNERWSLIAERADELKGKLTSVEDELVQRKVDGQLDGISYPAMLDAKLAELSVVVSSGDYAPTEQAKELFGELVERVDTQLARLQEVVDTDLAAFVNLLHELEVPAVVAG